MKLDWHLTGQLGASSNFIMILIKFLHPFALGAASVSRESVLCRHVFLSYVPGPQQ